MKVFIGMECSGAVRRAMWARGHYALSCDLQPADDVENGLHESGGHCQGNVFDVLENLLEEQQMTFDLALFFPDCTYLTISAEWAYGDGPYHQKVKPETLVGAARRAAREAALGDFRKLLAFRKRIRRIVVENPIGVVGKRVRPHNQIIQPHQFGDDASKATCLWLENLPLLFPTSHIAPRMVNGRPRWSNQTDAGQNRLSPSDDRAKRRSETYPGIAAALAKQYGSTDVFKLTG